MVEYNITLKGGIIMSILERWYEIPIVYEDEKPKDYVFKDNEFFIPYYSYKDNKVLQSRIISNCGTVIDLMHYTAGKDRTYIYKPEVKEGYKEKGYCRIGNERVHIAMYFSFLHYLLINKNTDERLHNHNNLQLVYSLLTSKGTIEEQEKAMARATKILGKAKGIEVHHIDRDRANNTLSNIELLPKNIHLSIEKITSINTANVFNSDSFSDGEKKAREYVSKIGSIANNPFSVIVDTDKSVKFSMLSDEARQMISNVNILDIIDIATKYDKSYSVENRPINIGIIKDNQQHYYLLSRGGDKNSIICNYLGIIPNNQDDILVDYNNKRIFLFENGNDKAVIQFDR